MLLEHLLHKLVATMVELCAAARGDMEPVGMHFKCHKAGLLSLVTVKVPGQSGTPNRTSGYTVGAKQGRS